MKVTSDQLKEGLARYIDDEFTSRLQGFSKWVIPVASAAIINNKMDALLSGNKDLMISLGYMSQDGLIDIDRLAADFISVAGSKGPVTEHFPLIGDVTFTSSEDRKSVV